MRSEPAEIWRLHPIHTSLMDITRRRYLATPGIVTEYYSGIAFSPGAFRLYAETIRSSRSFPC